MYACPGSPSLSCLVRRSATNSEIMAAQSEWTVVVGRQRKGKGRSKYASERINCDQSTPDTSYSAIPNYSKEDELKIEQKVQSSIEKLQDSPFYTSFLEQLKSPEILRHFTRIADEYSGLQMIIYGVGSIAESDNSRLQLSLALLMKKNCSWVLSIEVYDPIISSVERKIMESFGCTVLDFDEKGKRRVERPTLFFMPHCEAFLYDNLLQANWTEERLQNIVLLGNSFGTYLDQLSASQKVASASARYLLAIADKIAEFSVSTVSEDFFRAFHGTSWHFFCLKGLLPTLDFSA